MENKLNINDELLIAYLLGETSKEQNNEVENWINSSTENSEYFNELKKVWDISYEIKPKPIAVDIDKAWANVEKQLQIDEVEPKKAKIISFNLLRVAAVAIILVGLFFLYKITDNNTKIITQIAKNEPIIDTLSDGSVVSLNTNSTLNYPKKFNKNKRIVELTGEAFFEVTPNSEKPFIVDVGDAYIEVVGTKFNVNTTFDSNSVSVFVESGTVKLNSETSQSTLILKAGEKGIIYKSSGKTEKLADKTENLNDLYWKNKILVFASCPISDVASTLEKYYGVDIKISDKLKNLKLSATFENESFDQIMEVICITFNLNLTQNDKTYILEAYEK